MLKTIWNRKVIKKTMLNWQVIVEHTRRDKKLFQIEKLLKYDVGDDNDNKRWNHHEIEMICSCFNKSIDIVPRRRPVMFGGIHQCSDVCLASPRDVHNENPCGQYTSREHNYTWHAAVFVCLLLNGTLALWWHLKQLVFCLLQPGRAIFIGVIHPSGTNTAIR